MDVAVTLSPPLETHIPIWTTLISALRAIKLALDKKHISQRSQLLWKVPYHKYVLVKCNTDFGPAARAWSSGQTGRQADRQAGRQAG